MDDRTPVYENGNSHHTSQEEVVDIYPLGCYYFGSAETVAPLRTETLADRILRMKSNYDAYGMRTSVAAVIVVELFKHPHLLVLQVRNTVYNLPGGRLRPGESDVECLKRKLASKLSVDENGRGPQWENVLECGGNLISKLWLNPYLPPSIKSPKECTKLFLVRLPESRRFIVPKNFKLLAIPLCQLHGNDEAYGPIISGVPRLLSRFTLNMVEVEP